MALACRLLRSHYRLVPTANCCAPPSPQSTAVAVRTIAMSVPRLQMDEAVEQLKNKNPFYDRYAAKLAAMKEKAPEEFLEKVTQVVQPPQAPKAAPEKPR